MQLFQQQYRIIGSFGAPMSALARALDAIAGGRQAGDRHGVSAGRFRAGRGRGWSSATCSARSWWNSDPGCAGEPGSASFDRATARRCSGRDRSSRLHRRAVRAAAPTRTDARAGFLRPPWRGGSVPGCRRIASAWPICARRFRKRTTPGSRPRCGRPGTISAGSPASMCIMTGSGTSIPTHPEHRAASDDRQRAAVRSMLLTTASRRCASRRIWRTGSCRRWRPPAHGHGLGRGVPDAEQHDRGAGDHPNPRAARWDG